MSELLIVFCALAGPVGLLMGMELGYVALIPWVFLIVGLSIALWRVTR